MEKIVLISIEKLTKYILWVGIINDDMAIRDSHLKLVEIEICP